MRRLRHLAALLLTCVAAASPVAAYDLSTHSLISDRVVGGEGSRVDGVLGALGLSAGLGTDLSDERVTCPRISATQVESPADSARFSVRCQISPGGGDPRRVVVTSRP